MKADELAELIVFPVGHRLDHMRVEISRETFQLGAVQIACDEGYSAFHKRLLRIDML